MADNSTQIDELRLDITVEDKTSGESSDKKVKNLATAISRLNKNLQAFDNKKMSNVFANMAKGIDPFVQKIDKVSGALNSLATIVSKMGIDKAVEETTKSVTPLQKETVSGDSRAETKIQAMGGQAGSISESTEEVDEDLRDIDNRFDLLVAKGREIEKSLEKTKLSNKQILSLVSQRLTIESQLTRIKEQEDEAREQEKVQAQIAKAQIEAEKFRDSILGVTSKADLLKEQLKQVQSSLKQSGLTEQQYLSLKKQELNITEQINKAEGKKPRVPLSNLLKSFGRIAVYRAIRTVIKEITQAFTESIDGIARYNSEFRDTMGSLQSSMAKLKTSMGVAFYQVLILIEPLITQIANGIANLANSLSKVTANMRGVANYTKINTEYMKEYQSAVQGTLLSFDTFTTLSANQQIDYSKMFIEANDALDESSFNKTDKTIKSIFSTISSIFEVIKTIWEALEPILDVIINDIVPVFADILEPLSEIVSTITKALSPALKLLSGIITGILKQIEGAFKVISGLVKLLIFDFDGAFEDIGDGFKNLFNGIIDMFENLLKALFDPFGIFTKNINVQDISGGGTARFANGGMMTQNTFSGAGTMYALAGESGAEVVATGSSGTGVLNVDQFADAMVSALVRYGAARDNGSGTTIVLDGNKVGQLVASNAGFRNEANRRNAGLNWK